MRRDTGFSAQDAQSDFSRARRRRALADLSRRLRREPDDVDPILPFDEVVAALGKAGERKLGLQTIPLDSIVGTVDRSREFDRRFRPTSRRLRQRWERIAKAMRSGEAMPAIEVYRIGDMHFVVDGHHRVSVARQLGWDLIDAYVTKIVTAVGADGNLRLRDLATKSHERLFFERVPLPRDVRGRIQLRNRLWYAALAEGVEAWGMRAMQVERKFMTREEVAVVWYRDEYAPVVRMLDEADLIGDNTATEAYLQLSSLRYLLLRTHHWDEDILERLREELARSAPRDEDTMIRRLRGGLGSSAG
jgi:hypothetical protein